MIGTLIRTNMVSFADAGPGVSQKPLSESEADLICPQTGTPAFIISNNGSRVVVQSGSFQAEDGQKLTFGNSDITKTIELSEGTWAYNATGFFKTEI